MEKIKEILIVSSNYKKTGFLKLGKFLLKIEFLDKVFYVSGREINNDFPFHFEIIFSENVESAGADNITDYINKRKENLIELFSITEEEETEKVESVGADNIRDYINDSIGALIELFSITEEEETSEN